MDDITSYPPIDPTTFDLIVIGTGVPESILAAAASAVGKTVLHLDPNPFYGGHFSSLNLDEITSFLNSQSDSDNTSVGLTTRPIYSSVEISSHSTEPLEPRKFSLDLAGPRVLFCAESVIDLMIRSGASQYVEFKSVDASFVHIEGDTYTVPDSRSAIFRDKSLELLEKARLGTFFKVVEAHFKAFSPHGYERSEGKKISDEDLERPFGEFLDNLRLSPKLKSIILYAIALADYDQDDMKLCKHVLKTKDGINRLALYQSSVRRFSNAQGAMIYPIYGLGELPQAFCRRAAVKGCLYVLRMPVHALLMDKDNRSYKGVKVTSGQELFSQQVVLGPSFVVSNSVTEHSQDTVQARSDDLGLRDVIGKVARGICITKSSIKSDTSTFLMVYPPKSLHPEQVTSIRVLQIGSNLTVCPSGMFVSYISSLCDNDALGKKSLRAAIRSLFSLPISETAESSSLNEKESAETKPALLWSVLFLQELTTGSSGAISTTSTPDGFLNYEDIMDKIKEQFSQMFPDDEFFPTTSFVDPEADAALDQNGQSDSLDSQ